MELNVGFDEGNFDIIIRDITRSIQKASINENDLNGIQRSLQKKIDKNKRKYTTNELNTTINDIKVNITKTKFNKLDVVNISKKIKLDWKRRMNSLNPLDNLSGLPMHEKMIVIIKIIFRTLMNLFEEYIILFVAIFIVLNLQFRAKLPSSLLYPSDPNAYPYVYFDPNNVSQQSHLTSCVEVNMKDLEDDVFLDTPAYFTSDGKYSVDKNECKINNPFGIGKNSKCKPEGNADYVKYFTNNISFENMNFFAKQFIQTNSMKTTNELNLYSLITFLMLYVNCFSNNNMKSIHESFNVFFERNNNQSLIGYLVFFILTTLFYSAFQSSQNTFSKVIRKLIVSSTKRRNDNSMGKNSLFSRVINLLSCLLSPLVFFSKIMLIIVYPLILFHSVFGYMQYSTLASSVFTKLFCYFGVAFSLGNALTYGLLFMESIMKGGSSLDDFFDNLIQSFMKIIKSGINQFKSLQKNINDTNNEMSDLASGKTKLFNNENGPITGKGLKESFSAKGAINKVKNKIKKKKKNKEKKNTSEDEREDEIEDENENESTSQSTGAYGKGAYGKGGRGNESISGFGNFAMPGNPCPQIFPKLDFLKSIFKGLVMLMFLPVIIIMLTIPVFVSISLSFQFTKSISLDYFKYFNKLICEISKFKTIVRILFYMITIKEISKYMNKKFRGITVGILVIILLGDMIRDYIKQTMVANKCNMDGNNSQMNEKMSEIILSNN